MELRRESSPLLRLALLGLGLCAAIAAVFAFLLRDSIIQWASCPFRTATGVPCPTCGSTHAVVSLLQGHILTAVRYNPLTSGLAAVFLLAVLWSVGTIFIPGWRLHIVTTREERRTAVQLAALLILSTWLYEIYRLI